MSNWFLVYKTSVKSFWNGYYLVYLPSRIIILWTVPLSNKFCFEWMLFSLCIINWHINLLQAKLRSLSQIHFVLITIFAFTLTFDMAVLYGIDRFQSWYFPLKNGTQVFLWKDFRFTKNLFQSIENVQNFHWPSHKNMPTS